jgi:hypothetical protein
MEEKKLAPQEVLSAWNWEGEIAGILPYGQGHINDTLCVYIQKKNGDAARYILQRINTDTFRDPSGLMENICHVTEFLRSSLVAQGGDPERGTLNVVPTRQGLPFYRTASENAWRVYRFVEGTVCLQKAQQPQDFYECAVAFGKFQKLLAGFPAQTLHETIAHFHDTPDRYCKFEAAVAADACGRAASVTEQIGFVRARRGDCAYLAGLLKAGKLPLRVTHNDTKLNNVLMDKKTGRGLCVIDLDTVMPGLAAYDYGDSIRFGANDCAEDEHDMKKVHFSLPLFDIYTRGFLETVGDAFSSLEKQTLPWGAKLMTLECGMRFLTDYLEGDHYFHISRPEQNLDRARTQFKLVCDMEENWQAMTEIVARYSAAH